MKMLLGKPKQSLRGHTTDVWQVMNYWLENHPHTVQQVSRRIQVDDGELARFLQSAAFAHDFGKSSLLWQERLAEDGKRHDVSHPLLSALIVERVMDKKEKSSVLYTPFLLAIIAHHYMLHDDSYHKYGTDLTPLELHDDLKLLLQEWGNICDITLQPLPDKWGLKKKDGYLLLKEIKKSTKRKKQNWWNVKACYTFFLRLLMQADQCASEIEGKTKRPQKDIPAVNKDDEEVQKILLKWMPGVGQLFIPADTIIDKGRWWHSPRPMQADVRLNMAPYMIIHDTCGGGKTGAALTWARTLFEQGRIDRLIFTLPTKFTTNSMYQSLVDKHGVHPDQIGIYHGEARGFLAGIPDKEQDQKQILDQEEMDSPQVEQDRWVTDQLFLNTFYQKPITVSTVDHLIYSLLHCYKYSDRAFGNLVTAGVVFDELHYYDSYTMERIGEALELFRKLEIPHLIMSATMPDTFLQKLYEDATAYNGTGYVVVQGQACIAGTDREKIPARIVKMDVPMFEEGECHLKLKELIQAHRVMKQMIVVNWVERAKKIYRTIQEMVAENEDWQNIKVICYHSELTRKERKQIEEEIHKLFKEDQSCILISTQLCEMSLDISADVMFTEIAPLDAIGQRGGRLHRNGNSYDRQPCGCEFCVNRKYLPEDHTYTLYVFPLPFDEPKQLAPYDREIKDNSLISRKRKEGDSTEQKQYTNYLQRSIELLPDHYAFSSFCAAISELYRDEPFRLWNPEMKKFMEDDMVFGAHPSKRFVNEETEEGTSTGFAVRLIDFPKMDVIPVSCLGELKQECASMFEKSRESNVDELVFQLVETIKQYQVSVGVGKKKSYIWRRKQEGYYDERTSEPLTLDQLLGHLQLPPIFILKKYKGISFKITKIPYESKVGFNFGEMQLDEDPTFSGFI